jgi:hypothetical protein
MDQKATKQLTALSLVEFSDRFITRMISRSDVTYIRGGLSVRQYAVKAAPAYWEEAKHEGISPEECADEDMTYWGH